MNKGIYIALSGAILKRQDIEGIAQNIANANTSGFKKERSSFKDYIIPVSGSNAMQPDGRVMVQEGSHSIDFEEGGMTATGNPLDVAISGSGFFALEGNRYTRSGSFSIDNEGNLTTKDGIKVLGDGGPLSVQGSKVEIMPSGDIIVDDLNTGKLKIVDFADTSVLRKLNGSMFTANAGGQASDSTVQQGFLEDSNVNVIEEMIRMISSRRDFESYQKMIQAFDEASSKTINELGK